MTPQPPLATKPLTQPSGHAPAMSLVALGVVVDREPITAAPEKSARATTTPVAR